MAHHQYYPEEVLVEKMQTRRIRLARLCQSLLSPNGRRNMRDYCARQRPHGRRRIRRRLRPLQGRAAGGGPGDAAMLDETNILTSDYGDTNKYQPPADGLATRNAGILWRNGLSGPRCVRRTRLPADCAGTRFAAAGLSDLTERQMLALTDWGTNTANKKAYNVLTSIIGKDFYMPKNFVHARNANGRVAMGLHGYRIGIGEYGHLGRLGMPPPFLGWTPRHQWGFHLRGSAANYSYPGPLHCTLNGRTDA